jgi:hypothetical protein
MWQFSPSLSLFLLFHANIHLRMKARTREALKQEIMAIFAGV